MSLSSARKIFTGLIGLVLATIVGLFAAEPGFAQSSGNFTASVDNTVCSMSSATGAFGNGMFTQGEGGSLKSTIKLPNSSPGLLVTPSLVTGMYTNTLAVGDSTSNQTAAIVVVVTDEQAGFTPVVLTPSQTCVQTITKGEQCGVVYDERFQQLTTMLGSDQSVQLILSTLAAHSFNFTRGNVPGGIHTITVNWYFGCDNGSGELSTAACKSTFTANTAAACAGPGTLTVMQVQQFQHSSQIGTTGP